MVQIFSQTDNEIIQASPESTVLDAVLKAKINHTHVCGGNARCSTCRVYVLEGLCNCSPRSEEEKHLAEDLGLPEDVRLACQTRISGNIKIRRGVVDDLDRDIVLKQIGDAPGTRLGQEKDLAILFTDIVNYTQFAEALPAYDVVHVLNRYYQTMNGIIVKNSGIISDVAGDGILALFGVMGDSQNSVLDAIHTVYAMNSALKEFNVYLGQMYHRSFGIRAGINFGRVIIGSFDTGMMRKVSAIGDAVNLASRIEEANKALGTQLLISQQALEKITGMVEIHKKHIVKLKGKSGLYTLHEIPLNLSKEVSGIPPDGVDDR